MYAQEEMHEVSDIRLDTQEVVAREIEQNANSVPFEAIEEKPEPPTIPKAQAKEKEPVKVEGEQETEEQKAPF